MLIVDDDEATRRIFERILGGVGYECLSASEATAATTLMESEEIDLMVTDMQMPGASGLDLLLETSRNHPAIATMMVTSTDEVDLAEAALKLGAYGYLVKPVRANEVVIAVSNALRRRDLEEENAVHRRSLTGKVQDRTEKLWTAVTELERAEKEVRASRRETIHRLARAAEYRDNETGTHIERMSHYCQLLARASGEDAQRSADIKDSAAMHDVGKIGLPDSILLKPGPLTDAERDEMRKHPEMGHEILRGSDCELLELAATIAWTHHERMDGSGYPRGLKGYEIPIEGRIAAIADVFDALTTNRIYRRAFPLTVAIDMMKRDHAHFDPALLDLFWGIMDAVLETKEKLDAVVAA